jgi:photosystem II stability/assembly factor-like uncharacterized protein
MLQGALAVALGVVLSGCTFYTRCPKGMSCGDQGAGAADNGGGSAGSSSNPGGAGQIIGTPPTGSWSTATSNLTGMKAGFANVTYASAKPDEDKMIAGLSELGLWESSDGGESWQAMGTGTDSATIPNRPSAIQYDPKDSQVFWESGSYGSGVFRTDDKGVTFSQLGTFGGTDLISIDFTDPDRQTMLASGHEEGHLLRRSVDGGSSWEEITDNVSDEVGGCNFPLVLDDKTFLFTCSKFGGGSISGILGSVDGGETWTVQGAAPGSREALLASDGTVFWSGEGGGLLRSSDQGQSWTSIPIDKVLEVHPIELPDGRIATLTEQYVIVSADKGQTWTPVTSATPIRGEGLTYSKQQQAFFIWHATTTEGVPEDSLQRYDWDFAAR